MCFCKDRGLHYYLTLFMRASVIFLLAGILFALLTTAVGAQSDSTVLGLVDSALKKSDDNKPNAQAASVKRAAGIFVGPDTIADLVEAVLPSVVNIDIDLDSYGRSKYSSKSGKAPSSRNPAKGSGAGIIVRSDGLIITSNHLLEDESGKIKVTLANGQTYSAKVLGRDQFSDLALVKIEAKDLPTVKFGRSDKVRMGDWVLAIGSPLGLNSTVTIGIVSALNREAKDASTFGARSGAVKFIQTDAAINPGNSGGPLVNLRGEVIGINTFMHSGAQNIAFAIPGNVVQEISEKLVNNRVVPHAYIGIIMTDLTDRIIQSEGLPKNSQGVLVNSVIPKSPASNVPLYPGDLIVSIDEAPVSSSTEVSEAVRKHNIGDQLTLLIIREGKEKKVSLSIDQLPGEI